MLLDPSGAARTAPIPPDRQDFISATLAQAGHDMGLAAISSPLGRVWFWLGILHLSMERRLAPAHHVRQAARHPQHI